MRPPPALLHRATACAGECAATLSSHHRECAAIVAEIHDSVAGDGDCLSNSVWVDAAVMLDYYAPDRDVGTRDSLHSRERSENGAHTMRASHSGDRRYCHHRATIYRKRIGRMKRI